MTTTIEEGTSVVLRDGASVQIRPMHRTDADRLVRFHHGLSPETTRLRFFTFHPELSPREVEHFTHVDHRDREALVATVDDDIIGVARWDRVAAPNSAEVAFVVADDWQGRGIGQALLMALAKRARGAGVDTFVAQVLPDNTKMLAVFRAAGSAMKHNLADGVIDVEIPLRTDCGVARE